MDVLTLIATVPVVVVVALDTQRCVPSSWKAQERSISLAVSKINGFYNGFNEKDNSTVYYDKLNGRSAQLVNFTIGDVYESMKVIVDYKAGKRYLIDFKKNECVEHGITWGFNDICIPGNSDQTFGYYLGLDNRKGGYIDAVAFEKRVDYHGQHADLTVTLTKDLYVPVQVLMRGLDDDTYLAISLLSDVVSPFPPEESDVFDPPSGCTEGGVSFEVLPGAMAALLGH
ncbi:ependymin-related protein 2-like [Haliotis asinina]|uniref:ependymin-related protein 2-like n=1 Tax=Haliotis asinina TaxID=109174 RepID=UPI003531A9DA